MLSHFMLVSTQGFTQNLFIYGFIAVVILVAWLIIHLRNRVRKRKEHQLTHYDALTGLPNWEQMKSEIEKRGTSGALAVFEIKYFKAYNELMGYGVGDKILRDIGGRMLSVQQQYNVYVGRLQSASFAVLAPALGKEELREMLLGMLEQLRPSEADVKWSVRFACGAAYLKPGYGVNTALDNANYARKAAAEAPGTEVIVFDDEIDRDLTQNFSETGQLRQDAGMGELVVAFQPKYDMQTGKQLAGAEALIRWQHPERGLLLPAEFLPALEQTGNIKSIDNYVLRQVLWQIKDWHSRGFALPPVSVNVARVQFTNPQFAEEMAAVTREYGVSPAMIQLELTEEAFAYDMEQTISLLRQLKAAGFLLSLDDYGKGATSLALLRRAPLDMLNLDSSLLENIETDRTEQLMLRDIVLMAKDLRIVTLVKGVETEQQAAVAKAAGCNLVQGFLYARPMPAEEYETQLRPAVQEGQ